MTLLKDLFPQTPIKVAEDLLNDKMKNLAKKGSDITNADLYNLCLLNKERDELANKEKSN